MMFLLCFDIQGSQMIRGLAGLAAGQHSRRNPQYNSFSALKKAVHLQPGTYRVLMTPFDVCQETEIFVTSFSNPKVSTLAVKEIYFWLFRDCVCDSRVIEMIWFQTSWNVG